MPLSHLTALDSATGHQLWQVPFVSADSSDGDAIVDGVFYITGSRAFGEGVGVTAIDCATGRVDCTYTAPSGVVPTGVSGPLEGAVYATVYDHAARPRRTRTYSATRARRSAR